MATRSSSPRGMIAIVLLIVAAEFTTYAIFADRAMVRTVTDWLPQNVHLPKDTHFQFVCVSQDTWDALSHRQRAVAMSVLRPQYDAVFIGEDNIPRTKLKHDAIMSDEATGLGDGCVLTWRFRKGLLWFRGYYRDYEGTFSESYTNATYVWVLGGWVRVWRKSTTA